MFGFFAFNGGSQANITQKGDGVAVARAMANSMISGAAAALIVLTVKKLKHQKKWSLLLTINAALTGRGVCVNYCGDKPAESAPV